jgi:hypothetical protein
MSPPPNKSGKTPGWGEREPLKAKWSIPNANKYTLVILLKMYVQIMSLSVLLCNVCLCYGYILKMSKKNKSKKKKTLLVVSPCLHAINQIPSLFKDICHQIF